MTGEEKREYISFKHGPCQTIYSIDVTFIEVPHSISSTNKYQTSFQCPKCKGSRETLLYEEGDVKDKPEGELVNS